MTTKISTTKIPRGGRLPAALQVTHGPVGLFGRYFLQADAAARERGITLSFGTLDELIATNVRNRDSWRGILPIFDPVYGAIHADNAFCIFGRNADGEIVTTQAARLYDWEETDFHTEANSLRLFYRDPEAQKRPDEQCVATAEAGRLIKGRVAFTGGVWYRPDVRGRSLSYLLTRIGRAYAHTLWNCDYICSIMVEDIFKMGFLGRFGYRNFDWEVRLINSNVGRNVRCALVWQTPDELIEDTAAFSAGVAPQIDAAVGDRRA